MAAYRTFAAQPTEVNLKGFLESTLPGLERAMVLFGTSLRRGETPDDISRRADALSSQFAADARTLATLYSSPGISVLSAPIQSQLARTTASLDAYLAFAGLAADGTSPP